MKKITIKYYRVQFFAPLTLRRKDIMYKIKYLPTGNVFVLPKDDAMALKEKSPSDYQIIEKNGRKVKDKIKPKIKEDEKSIFSKVVEKE